MSLIRDEDGRLQVRAGFCDVERSMGYHVVRCRALGVPC
jgi:hypothetical protein